MRQSQVPTYQIGHDTARSRKQPLQLRTNGLIIRNIPTILVVLLDLIRIALEVLRSKADCPGDLWRSEIHSGKHGISWPADIEESLQDDDDRKSLLDVVGRLSVERRQSLVDCEGVAFELGDGELFGHAHVKFERNVGHLVFERRERFAGEL
jgi:hypothetical protein